MLGMPLQPLPGELFGMLTIACGTTKPASAAAGSGIAGCNHAGHVSEGVRVCAPCLGSRFLLATVPVLNGVPLPCQGAGSLFEALNGGKTVVAVPNALLMHNHQVSCCCVSLHACAIATSITTPVCQSSHSIRDVYHVAVMACC
jgi:hypothetical protein